jgi:glycosyltransferase involved in cell wall biosynthesis
MTLHPDSAGEVTPSKLRILLVIYAYPPVLGGSEIEAQRVAAALIQRGHEVQVLCTGGPEMPQVRNWVDPAGVPVSILTRRSKGLWKDRIFALRVAWRIWSGRREYDVVYFLMQGLHLASGLPAAHLAGKPVVAKISGSGIIPVMQGTRKPRAPALAWNNWCGCRTQWIRRNFVLPNREKLRPGGSSMESQKLARLVFMWAACLTRRACLDSLGVSQRRRPNYLMRSSYSWEMVQCGQSWKLWCGIWVPSGTRSGSLVECQSRRFPIGFGRAMSLR